MKRLLLPAALFLVAGCASTGGYYERINGLVRDSRYAEAGAFAGESRKKIYGAKNDLLYFLDRGFLLHLAGDYRASNEAFETAQQLSRELFTKSISAEAATFLVSDNVRPYYGEDFERVLIHVFSALNYVLLDDYEAALVETRRADHVLRTLETHYDGKMSYREDAFARYLSGLIQEEAGEINSAHVSYLRALDAYDAYLKNYGTPPPARLAADAVRTAERLGMKDRAREIISKRGVQSKDVAAADSGEIVIVLYAGLSPVKIDSFFEISFGRAWIHVGSVEARGDDVSQVEQAGRIARSIAAEDQVVMAFPKYAPSPYRAARFDVALRASAEQPPDGNAPPASATARAEMAEDIGAIAVKVLDERIGRIRAKTIARSAVKYALSKKIGAEVAKSSNDRALGWLAQKIVAGAAAATELADKRSWRTLPDKIFLARLPAATGTYDIVVDFYDNAGYKVTSETIKSVSVRKGRRTFAALRSAM
ncbi:MAG: hypothetical protein CVU77_06195 [Elusimicrobia bacterium HGW-Elusimicrobia-1]|jgi:hypothetical protein|nr:MAG: hypothetical protein CVU79_08225 [Elusimicrobia bacterium HGW-Elusimicrobia-3]PKN01268.1 MAG: hypothetical protein CVU77_06195 [Elusimicrobia bacterium HGW-Elusimicrobia-1]